MPGHYSSRELNVFSVCTPTGGLLLPACGTAWAMKLDGKDSVALASVGDAATRQGEFFEAIAFAVQEKLPVIFLVEDNKFGISTPTEKFLPFRLGLIPEDLYVKVDARDPRLVLESAQQSVEKARRGQGPTVIWADLDRLSSHTSSDDHRVYRSLEDIEEMGKRDPIRLLADRMIASGELDEATLKTLQEEAVAQVDADYIRAEKQPDPEASSTLAFSFADESPAPCPPLEPSARTTMVSAINSVFKSALEQNEKTIFFGEDIEDPKGGVFGITKGLSREFPKQVFNSPLAEATVMGVAVGMAAYGFMPIFELQFVDFMAPGWNQITTNMSSIRWRSNNQWTCPCVIYAPCGAYLPGGSLWHSQSNESYLSHTPGIRLAVPSTPEDAAGLFWTAIQGDDPTFILVPKHVFRKPVEVVAAKAVPFGKAKIVKYGKDVTLVTWGNCVELAQEVAANSAADIEIIDLRSLVPCDYGTITDSLNKTGRLVVVHEDNRTSGFGQTIVAEMTGSPERWNLFLSPPQLVAREDVHIGYNPIYEYAALPDAEQVRKAIEIVMS